MANEKLAWLPAEGLTAATVRILAGVYDHSCTTDSEVGNHTN